MQISSRFTSLCYFWAIFRYVELNFKLVYKVWEVNVLVTISNWKEILKCCVIQIVLIPQNFSNVYFSSLIIFLFNNFSLFRFKKKEKLTDLAKWKFFDLQSTSVMLSSTKSFSFS